MAPTYEYYAAVPPGRTASDPVGVIRRCRLRNGVAVDQAFTRNLRWESTDALHKCDRGYSDETFERITEAAAESFVRQVAAHLGGTPNESWPPPAEGTVDLPRRITWRRFVGRRGTPE